MKQPIAIQLDFHKVILLPQHRVISMQLDPLEYNHTFNTLCWQYDCTFISVQHSLGLLIFHLPTLMRFSKVTASSIVSVAFVRCSIITQTNHSIAWPHTITTSPIQHGSKDLDYWRSTTSHSSFKFYHIRCTGYLQLLSFTIAIIINFTLKNLGFFFNHMVTDPSYK